MCEVNDFSDCDFDISEFEEKVLKKSVPTQTQVRQQLGSRLSDVFFEYLSSEAKAWLGLTPPLTGPDVVWIDPRARLENKVTLTPVPEPASLYLKALTHGAILEVGGNYVAELVNKNKLELEEALRNQALRFEEEAKDRAKMVQGNENLTDEERFNELKNIVGTLMEHFEKCFDELMETNYARLMKECQLKVEEEREDIASHMFAHLQNEVDRREYELCNDFHCILYNELNVLEGRHIDQINQEREIAVKVLQDTVKNYEAKINEIKAEMEMCTTIDICQAITRERIECNKRIKQVRGDCTIKRGSSLEVIESLRAENMILQKMSTERLKRLMEWRKKVGLLLEEFQRFINFALKAVPGQAEYLLSMEKLMLKRFPQDTFILPEDYIRFQKCLDAKIPPVEEVGTEEKQSFKVSEASDKSKCRRKVKRSDSSIECLCKQSVDFEDKSDSKLNFDFDKFKSKIIMRYMPSLLQQTPKKHKQSDCLWKKKKKEESIDKSNPFYQTLIMVGESEKEHEAPINEFLERRLKAVLKICQDDPEFAKIMLGCSDK